MRNQEITDRIRQLREDLSSVGDEIYESDARILHGIAIALQGIARRTSTLAVQALEESRKRKRDESKEA